MFNTVVACTQDVVKEEKPINREKSIHVEDAETLFKKYSAERYTIKEPSNPPTSDEIAKNIEGYVTDKQYKVEMSNRIYQLPELVSKQINKSIQVEDVKLEEQSKNDDGTVDYLYTTKLKVYDENSSKVYEKKGELTITIKNDELKIDREWSRGVKIDGLDSGGL